MVFELLENELDELVRVLPKSGVVLLSGDLASGKTTLVKAIIKAHGINESVTSPTFSLMQIYGKDIYHYDIYQIGFDGMAKNGLFENLFEEGLHLIEWADENLINLLKKYELDFCVVRITPHAQGRKYEVSYA